MSIKVLVFESDASFANELRNELGKLGCSTCVVDDGSVGLQQASAEKPDLILLSIELPRMNGFSVCNKLKKDAALKDVPLIIMSSESSDETFEQHRKLRTRAEDYVHKPIAFGELLSHIQTFVPMGDGGENLADTDGIVIDDEIAIQEDEEGTQIAMRPNFGGQQQMKNVDADVDAFTDAAFGRMTGGPDSSPPTEGPNTINGAPSTHPAAASSSPAGSGPATSSSRQSARPRAASVRAPAGDAESERLRGELDRAKSRVDDLEKQLEKSNETLTRAHQDADAEAERMQRELEELKARLSSAPKGGGVVSSREFLDLRETLNKKDKEILALKQGLSAKDKEIYETRDRALSLERAQSELDDKVLAKDRELADVREKTDELTAQIEKAETEAKELRARIEKTEVDAEARAKELASFEAKGADERAANEAALAGLRADHQRALEQAEARRTADLERAAGEHQAAFTSAKQEHDAAFASAKEEMEASLTQAREDASRERTEAVATREAALRAETEGKLAAAHRAHQDELGRVRAEAARELEASQKEATERLAAQEGDLARQRAEAIAALEAKVAAELADARNSAEVQEAEAHEKIHGLESELAATKQKVKELEEAKVTSDAANEAKAADLSQRLAQVTTAREEVEKSLAASGDRVMALEVDIAGARGDLEDTRRKLEAETARAEKAIAKWNADRGSLERAKDALAVALSQIEEAEGRAIGE